MSKEHCNDTYLYFVRKKFSLFSNKEKKWKQYGLNGEKFKNS